MLPRRRLPQPSPHPGHLRQLKLHPGDREATDLPFRIAEAVPRQLRLPRPQELTRTQGRPRGACSYAPIRRHSHRWSCFPIRSLILGGTNCRCWPHHIFDQDQMSYVAATLNAAGIPSQHSTLNYAKVNPDHHFYKITPHWFMLTVPYLGATVRLKEPTKTRPMLLWTHASSVGGTRGILRSRQIHPSRQHSSECPAFYAQGWKITGHADYDAEEIARTMSQNWSMSFNMAQLLLFGRAVGTCQPIRSGGEQACIEALDSSERPDVIHYVSGKCWMVIPEASQIVGLAWPTDAKPPTGVLRS